MFCGAFWLHFFRPAQVFNDVFGFGRHPFPAQAYTLPTEAVGPRLSCSQVHSVMLTSFLSRILILLSLCSGFAISQEQPSASRPLSALELPVIFQQSITAGKTAAGTKVQAKLQVATLMGHTVIPRDSILEGEVIESVSKSKTAPSILAIRITSVQWKSGTEKLNVYLVPWFYPPVMQQGQELQYGPSQPANRTWNGQGQYPDSSGLYKPFPGSDSDKASRPPGTLSTETVPHRSRMSGIESQRSDDGVIRLVSKKSNIKLDRVTTYIVSDSDLASSKSKER